MSESIRNYEDLRKKLEIDKDYYETMLECLNKVEIKRKKDGTHFANQNQTFINGKVVIPSYMDSFHPVFKVYGQSKMQGCLDFSFDCYIYVDNLKDDDERKQKAKKANSWSRETYVFTTDEIIEEIERQKENAKYRIKLYENQIERSKKVFDKVHKRLQNLKDLIYTECKDLRDESVFRCSLEYALMDYVKWMI